MKKLLIASFLVILLASCFGDTKSPEVTKDISYYKTLWKDTFQGYQAVITKIPKKWKFDFEISSMVSGSGEALSGFAGVPFREQFSSLSIGLLGDYDFLDAEHPALDATMKIYLNKRSFGAGDIDVTFKIDASGSTSYSLNHLDRNTLEFFWASKDIVDELMLAFEQNGGKLITSGTHAEFLKEVFKSIAQSEKNSPLRENSKEEEAKIIKAFLESEVLEVTAGVEKEEGISRLSLRLNPEHTVKFLDEVAIILGGAQADKKFDSNTDFLKSFTVQWTLDIQDKKIIDSRIMTEVPLSSVEESTGDKKYDALITENRFIYANPERFDIDLTTLISTKNTPNNKLQLHFRWLIK